MTIANSSTIVTAKRYRFAHCMLDITRRELQVDGQPIPLQARTFDLLAYLVCHPGQALSKETLISAIWPTTHVTDAVLTNAIAKIRRAIGDNDNTAPIVRTLHAVGYRFDTPVSLEDNEPFAASNMLDLGANNSPSPSLQAATGRSYESSMTPAFWLEQLDRIRKLDRQGQIDAALTMLRQALPYLPSSPDTSLLHARLLRLRLQTEEAQEVLQRALTNNLGYADAVQKASLLLESARLKEVRQDMTGAMADCSSAIELLSANPGNTAELAAALALQTHLYYMQGQYARVSQLTQRLIDLSQSTQDPSAIVESLLLRARAAIQLGQMKAAQHDSELALEHARQAGLSLEQADAYIRLSQLASLRWDHESQIDYARRSALLATDQGDLTRRDRARAQELLGLIHAGRINEASQLLASYEAAPSLQASAVSMYNFGFVRADLTWRQGRHEASLQMLQALVDLPEGIAATSRRQAQLFHAGRALGLGQDAPARQLLEADWLSASQKAGLTAGLALHAGDREGAKQILRTDWINSPGSGENALSLAFMMLEDKNSTNLEEVIDSISRLPTTHAQVALLHHIHALHRQSTPLEPLRWTTLVRNNAGLLNRHAWLLDIDEVRKWLAGGRKLAERYPTACF